MNTSKSSFVERSLPDGVKLTEIYVYAPKQEITRLGILFDLAGFEMVSRITDKQRPDHQNALFQK